MQLLYMIDTANDLKLFTNPVQQLQKNLDKTLELFVFLIHQINSVCKYAETDANYRASKHLPTYEDLNVNTKIAGNLTLWQILENETFQQLVTTFKPENSTDNDLIRKLYNKLTATDNYKIYIQEASRDKLTDKQLYTFVLNEIMLPDENFDAYVEELFNNWDDDAEMLQELLMAFIAKPNQSLQKFMTEEKWNFGKQLLVTTINKKDYTLELIKPKLKNWDSERIAVIDMILMQMGVAELLYFETIPTKVTINEYIDLAKAYSTPQSGQFVNGILDSIHKELLAAGKIHKIEYKKK